ncbi:MAG TPA: isoprenylcysteine carboxylmethyltransferase family protein [Candidatus Margulisiibacteriota bacterium]|nr:isoprenylcysteine carboxylmethyltransferase family protein [Candidatus Margulisiibacteriota bacterium]
MKKRLKVNGIIGFFAFILIILFPAVFLRSEPAEFWDSAAEVFGIAMILMGQLLRICARGYKAENSKRGEALIQGGPYALVRNPMYLGILLIGLGIVLVLFQWWASAIFLLIFVMRYLLLIFKEEKKLQVLFPKEFSDYQKRVPRILPSISALARGDISEYLPVRPIWIKREIGSVCAVLFLTLLLETWEDIIRQGARFYLRELTAIFLTILLFVVTVVYLSRTTSRNDHALSARSKNNSE